ncbi:hypothetical protein [Lysinibacillus piscis]|uniref:Uncharacterized protein n=1 Tax=Lysinibacillus piscis TaxID=2518931 RepID=A0ABQ5NJX9_9BACI|nr:hypothetical protein [Lysinibacillus sp. KH24]GLC88674.1 hypothetical protein LYSBPC_18010 [Lysinibacillus sp. KH24]
MKQEQLDAIKERAVNATDGPWQVYEMEDGTQIGTVEHHPQLKSPMHVVTMSYWGEKPYSRVWIDKDNAKFIAHAREDVPALIAELERLKSELQGIISVAKEEIESQSPHGYEDIIIIAHKALVGEADG